MFISAEGKKQLHNYSFRGEDHSFCANYILAPYLWEPLLQKYIPRYIAPNILTTLGFVSMALCWVITAFVLPTGLEEMPRYLYVLMALFIFLYQIADNIDGRQARRTHNATPLGELFDHGNDSIMIGIFALFVVLCLHVSTTLTLIVLLMLYLVFFLSHWEEYHTGVLILNALLNPTELQLIMIAVLIVEAIYPGVMDLVIFGLQVNTTIAYCTILGAFLAFLFYSFNVYKLVTTTKMCRFSKSVTRLTPFLLFFFTMAILFVFANETYLQQNFQKVTAITILVNAYITQRIILNRICKEEVDLFYYINIIFCVFVTLVLLASVGMTWINASLLTTVMLIISIAQEIVFAISVARTICSEIGIRVWMVKIDE
uniref:Choline/ethanolaminephosphotransferase, putative n=2 Tax=Entamoeba invadens TaxID=33085 RepID=S0B1P8_ENTIV|nr:choline/ethanolaminephosphotransferase, putative [Entamoeba invadens]